MLKAVLSVAVPLAIAAVLFGSRAANVISNAVPERPAAAARAAAPADTRGCRRGEEMIVGADSRGHFQVSAEVNGRFVWLMVDTGATRVILPHEDAVRLGLELKGARQAEVNTANGLVSAVATRAERLRLGPICLTNIDVIVMPPGRLSVGLLGMNAIGALNRFEMQRQRLVMAH